jgi:hypothetical protein
MVEVATMKASKKKKRPDLHAPMSAVPPRTLIDTPTARRIFGAEAFGPRACTTYLGQRWCGPTLDARFEFSADCTPTVSAIVVDLLMTPHVDAIIGQDALAQVGAIDPRTGRFASCRRRRRRA